MRTNFRSILGLLALAQLLFLSGLGQATTVKPMNLKELVSEAQTVVKAKVISKDAAIDTAESGMMVTYYTLEVSEWLKGEPTTDGELVIKQVGQGQFTMDGYRIRQNYYFPDYTVGETYVLFLPEAHPVTGLLAPMGLFQGVFDVEIEDGQEVIPQLKARSQMLQRGIPETSANKFLRFQLTTAADEPTYSNFKSMIKSAGE